MSVSKVRFNTWSRIGLWLGGMFLSRFLVVNPLEAEETKLARQTFEVWRVEEDGGQQNPITSVVQSKDGYLWLGTYHGLVRFDGVRSTVFDSGNTPGLQNGSITSLFENSDGSLWIGHETGQLTRFSEGRFEPVKLGRAWPGGAVEAITTDEDRDLWLLNDTGVLFRLRDGQTATAPGGASPTRKAALVRSPTGKPWIVCSGQVATLEHGAVVRCQIEGSDSSDYFERVLPARDGGLWMLGNQRLRKWRDGRWLSEVTGGPATAGAVSVLLETRSGALLAGTLRDGLYVFNPEGEILHFSRTNGLSHDWVRALCEDLEGNIWLGTAAGLDGLRARKVQMLSASDDFQGCGVLSFSVTGDDSAWVGTEGAGLYRYEGGRWSSFTETSGLSNLFVWSVLETREKDLFVGTWGGGLVVKRGEHFESPGDLSKISAPVVSLYQAKKGALWIGTTIGLYRYEQGKLAWFAGKDRLAFPDIRAITESADGTIWVGMSGGGLGALRGDTIRQMRKQDGLGSDFVISLYADQDGTIWVGTSDHGLTRFKNSKFASINTEQGLPNNIICHIVDDGAGNLWLSSHRGILRASKDELNRCADGETQSVHWLSYGKAEGLTSQACAGGFQPGATRAANGKIWIPTAKGLAIIDPANVSTNSVIPPVVIEEMLADGQAVELRQARDSAGRSWNSPPVKIPPGKQRFELHYTGLSLVSPDKVRFRHRLSGLDDQWTHAGTKRVAEYSYLRPGTYRFQVIACNNDGLWNEQGAELAFTVLPYFWQTWWFEVSSGTSVALVLGAGVFSVSRRRVRRKLEQSERQRALERERARIARDIHDDLGASLTRITMLSQSVRAEIEGQAQATADVDQIYGTARELTRAMDEIVWAVNPKHDTLDSLVTYLGRFAQQFLSAAGIRFRQDVPVYLPSWALTSEIRHNVFLALKEALHNVVKHADATEVRIFLELQPRGFVLVLVDNGRGFDLRSQAERSLANVDGPRISSGNGLPNMQKRLEEIGGRCEWNTAPGEGTRVKFVVKTHDS
jgi:signal transduction histidine kinase/ligand-binding sensor domain-containing protein